MAQVQQIQPPVLVSGPAAVAMGGVGVGVNSVGAGVVGVNPFPTTSLYVGDLELNVSDAHLFDVFSQVGQVVSVRICRDVNTRRSLGYGYVNFGNVHDAAKALEILNFTHINGKAIRIMYSNRDPSIRKSGAANIFIKNLDKSIDNKALHDTFSTFGNILSCKVATDPSGQSKGYGFVQFEQDESAQSAIDKLNGMLVNDKKVYVGPFQRRRERDNTSINTKFNNVFVKNLSETASEVTLEEVFGKYGKITSKVVMREGDGKSKCFGFVNFENPDSATKAVEELNGKVQDGVEWYVGKAQKKSEREMELKSRFDKKTQDVAEKFQGVNLYLKNLEDNIGDDKLKELFSPYGTITSCKVMKDQSGVSKGSGFVAFETAESASKALSEMNGKMVGSKPLYVALAQRKEERRARLQAQFSQLHPMVMPPVGPHMPMYPPGTPALGQQIFYGQPPPALIPQPAGFGFQQPLVAGMRPGAGPVPNFFMPVMQQGQRPVGRRAGAGPVQQTPQAPVPLPQQPLIQRAARGYRYPAGRNMTDGVPGEMLSADMAGLPVRDAGMSQPIPIGALASALANATPDQQRTMLGESLYPLVDQLEHDNAAKVTGMLLEMDQTEVLHLLESPEALKLKVAEAMEVLKTVAQQQLTGLPTSQLAVLSLNGVVS